ALVQMAAVLGDEGIGGDGAGEGGVGYLQGEGGEVHALLAGGGEGGVAPALVGQAAHVKFGGGQAAGEALLGQHGPVFRDEVVPGKDQVGGGLPLPGVGVHIAAQQPRRLPGHQAAAVVRLAHRLVGGGQVEDEGGPVGGQL